MVGKKLGHYPISSQIGKVGMGEVYRAKDQKVDAASRAFYAQQTGSLDFYYAARCRVYRRLGGK